MRAIITFILGLLLIAFVSCGNQDESTEQPEKPQTTVSAPDVDLHTAVILENSEVIRQHIKAGSDLNIPEPTRGSTPLITAVALDKTEAAKILIDAGVDLNCQNNDGSTALHTAAFFCREEIVQILLDKGADKSLKNKAGRTALETVELPFEDVKDTYDAIKASLRSLGLKLDYEYIEATRPKIAEMLK